MSCLCIPYTNPPNPKSYSTVSLALSFCWKKRDGLLIVVSRSSWYVIFLFLRFKVIGKNTPLKTNMSPENQWLEDVFPIEMVPLGGTC